MTRRTKCLLLLLVVGVGVGGYAGWDYAMMPEPGVTLANYDRLESEMTVEQVSAILGRPPDGVAHEVRVTNVTTYSVWYGDGVEIGVCFAGAFRDQPRAWDGFARARIQHGPPEELRRNLRTPESALDTVRRFLHL